MSQYERYKQTIGRYQVFIRGNGWDADVIMRVSQTNAERNLTPREALILLAWLNEHKLELTLAVIHEEQEQTE